MELDLTLRDLSPARNLLVRAVIRARERVAGPTPPESDLMTTADWQASFARVLKFAEDDLAAYDRKHPEETRAARALADEAARNRPTTD